MRLALILITTAALASPASALAKAGVEFERLPDTTAVGQPINFTVMAFHEPGRPGWAARPIVDAHPLVTFRSRSGRVLRVRTSATDLNGIAHGVVRFADHGPWTTAMHVGNVEIPAEQSVPVRVGVGLFQLIPSANQERAALSRQERRSALPWVWVFSSASILAALLVLLMRRRGHWGAA
ncbi:MAG: hypothetical protein QOC55_1743 [Thermoleophilaceae bacterium]|jgi:hypothetical protein|nr:hypothetical protein [Thermoleophilaceae bacterium]